MVIILSDFIDEHYLKSLKSLNKYHDVICLHIYDDQEINIPKLGIIPVEEKEDNFKKWINTSSNEFQKMTQKLFKNDAEDLKREINSVGINYLKINSKENYIKKLIKLFKYRKNK